MKTKQFLFMMIVLPLLLGTVGCDKPEKENELPKELIGSWKLKGFGDKGDNAFREAEPKDCEKCYILTLENNGKFNGQTSINLIGGQFLLNQTKQIIKFEILQSTYANEHGNGDLYGDCLNKATSYSYTKEGLKLFYEADKYLLYKKIELLDN